MCAKLFLLKDSASDIYSIIEMLEHLKETFDKVRDFKNVDFIQSYIDDLKVLHNEILEEIRNGGY